MAEPFNKKQSLDTLYTTFGERYGLSVNKNTLSLNLYKDYKNKHFKYITNPEGESYWLDERTNQKVTNAYKNKIRKELKSSWQAILNFNKISLDRAGKVFNLIDLKNQLSIAKDRGRFFTEAQQGDKPRRLDKPRYTYNKNGELVITGGQTQHYKIQRIKDLEEKVNNAEAKVNAVLPNRYNKALQIINSGLPNVKLNKSRASALLKINKIGESIAKENVSKIESSESSARADEEYGYTGKILANDNIDSDQSKKVSTPDTIPIVDEQVLVKDKAPAMHWADEILKKYPKSWLKSRVDDIDRAYPGFDKLAKQKLLVNPITQLELEA